jgi:peptidoglycan/LPS O-acetylase OafA/YrhL
MASTLAFVLAQYLTVSSADFIGFDLKAPRSYGTIADSAPVLAFVIGGAVGGFVVVLAVLALFSVENRPSRILVKALRWSMAGGALGAVGWAMGPFVGGVDHSMFFVWETGMGLTLGLMLAIEGAAVESH